MGTGAVSDDNSGRHCRPVDSDGAIGETEENAEAEEAEERRDRVFDRGY